LLKKLTPEMLRMFDVGNTEEEEEEEEECRILKENVE
jgi:hypothetical protein